ncbi:MAG: hypothetical protein WDA72_12985 [Desulfomonilia bacterium]|nr:hypothetical protein [Desulfomonilia bacterium]
MDGTERGQEIETLGEILFCIAGRVALHSGLCAVMEHCYWPSPAAFVSMTHPRLKFVFRIMTGVTEHEHQVYP